MLELTEGWFPRDLTDPTAVTPAEVALAGLARARRLLWGMLELHSSAPDLVGGLARSLFETWLNVTYVLLGGDEAEARVQANDNHERRRIAQRLVELDETDDRLKGQPDWDATVATARLALDATPGDGGTLRTYDMTLRVREHLADQDAPDPQLPIRLYAVLYGPESYVATHSGLGAIKQYLGPSVADPEYVVAGPWNDGRSERRLDLGTAMVNGLAYQVGLGLGLDTNALEEFTNEWSQEAGD